MYIKYILATILYLMYLCLSAFISIITLGQICQLVPVCEGFTWIGPDFANAPANNCYLKSDISGQSTKTGIVSGLKGCSSSGFKVARVPQRFGA